MVNVYEFAEFFRASSVKNATVVHARNTIIPIGHGQPVATHEAPGSVTFQADTRLVKIQGTGAIQWPNGLIENFDGVEYRSIDGLAGLEILA